MQVGNYDEKKGLDMLILRRPEAARLPRLPGLVDFAASIRGNETSLAISQLMSCF